MEQERHPPVVYAIIAQLGERILDVDEVRGSSPLGRSYLISPEEVSSGDFRLFVYKVCFR